jgi:hypothetical protein
LKLDFTIPFPCSFFNPSKKPASQPAAFIVRVVTMGIFLDEPKFPVIERNPSAGSTVSNFSFGDYMRITAFTATSLPVGYLAGPSFSTTFHWRLQNASVLCPFHLIWLWTLK